MSVKIINVGYIACLVMVKIMWAKDPGSSPKSSGRLPTDTLNISLRTKVVWNKTATHWFPKKKPINITCTNLKLNIWSGLKIIVSSRELLGPTLIGLYSVFTTTKASSLANLPFSNLRPCVDEHQRSRFERQIGVTQIWDPNWNFMEFWTLHHLNWNKLHPLQ